MIALLQVIGNSYKPDESIKNLSFQGQFIVQFRWCPSISIWSIILNDFSLALIILLITSLVIKFVFVVHEDLKLLFFILCLNELNFWNTATPVTPCLARSVITVTDWTSCWLCWYSAWRSHSLGSNCGICQESWTTYGSTFRHKVAAWLGEGTIDLVSKAIN